MGSVLGSILDPAADKLLMTTMVITLAMRDMLPGVCRSRVLLCVQQALKGLYSQCRLPCSSLVAMSPFPSPPSTSAMSHFRHRCVQLVTGFHVTLWGTDKLNTVQKTFARYWDFSIPSASVHPTTISKYNTFLQLVLVGATTVAPLLPFELGAALTGLQ